MLYDPPVLSFFSFTRLRSIPTLSLNTNLGRSGLGHGDAIFPPLRQTMNMRPLESEIPIFFHLTRWLQIRFRAFMFCCLRLSSDQTTGLVAFRSEIVASKQHCFPCFRIHGSRLPWKSLVPATTRRNIVPVLCRLWTHWQPQNAPFFRLTFHRKRTHMLVSPSHPFLEIFSGI